MRAGSFLLLALVACLAAAREAREAKYDGLTPEQDEKAAALAAIKFQLQNFAAAEDGGVMPSPNSSALSLTMAMGQRVRSFEDNGYPPAEAQAQMADELVTTFAGGANTTDQACLRMMREGTVGTKVGATITLLFGEGAAGVDKVEVLTSLGSLLVKARSTAGCDGGASKAASVGVLKKLVEKMRAKKAAEDKDALSNVTVTVKNTTEPCTNEAASKLARAERLMKAVNETAQSTALVTQMAKAQMEAANKKLAEKKLADINDVAELKARILSMREKLDSDDVKTQDEKTALLTKIKLAQKLKMELIAKQEEEAARNATLAAAAAAAAANASAAANKTAAPKKNVTAAPVKKAPPKPKTMEESLIAMIRHLHSAPTSNMTSCDIKSRATEGKFDEIVAEKDRIGTFYRKVEDVIDTHSLVLERVLERKRAEDTALFDELIRVKKAVAADVGAFGKAADSLAKLWGNYVSLNASVVAKSDKAVARLKEIGDLVRPVENANAELQAKKDEVAKMETTLQGAISAKEDAKDNMAAKRDSAVKDMVAKFVPLQNDAGTNQAALGQLLAQAQAPTSDAPAKDGMPAAITKDDLFASSQHVEEVAAGVKESAARIGSASTTSFLETAMRALLGAAGNESAANETKPAIPTVDAVNSVIDGYSSKDLKEVESVATQAQKAKELFQQRVAMLVFLQKDIAKKLNRIYVIVMQLATSLKTMGGKVEAEDDGEEADSAAAKAKKAFEAMAAVNTTNTTTPPKRKPKLPKVAEFDLSGKLTCKTLAASNCTKRANCEECTMDPACGWCGEYNVCVEGDADDPYGCSCPSWDYSYCERKRCQNYKTCSSCVNDPACGYCASTGTCYEGDTAGPTFDSCSAWNKGYCSTTGHWQK